MIRALVEWIIAQPALTTYGLRWGTTVWVGPIREQDLGKLPDRLVVFLEHGGHPETFGLVGQGRLQVLVRDDDFWKAREIAFAIHGVLHETYNRAYDLRNAANQTVGTEQAWSILADAEPAEIGRDSKGRPEFSQNYTLFKSRVPVAPPLPTVTVSGIITDSGTGNPVTGGGTVTIT